MERWVVRGVPATVEKRRKRHQEDEQEKAIAQARREQDAPSCGCSRGLGAALAVDTARAKGRGTRHTTKSTRRSWWIIASIWPRLNRPRACLRQSVPARRTPKSGPRAWEFGSPAAAAAWAVGTAHPRKPSRRCGDWDSSARRDRRGARTLCQVIAGGSIHQCLAGSTAPAGSVLHKFLTEPLDN